MLDGLIESDVGIVDDSGSGGDDERAVFSLFIEPVALSDLVGMALGTAAAGTDFLTGIDVNFVRALRKDDRTYVAAFHDKWPKKNEGTLVGNKALTHFVDAGDE